MSSTSPPRRTKLGLSLAGGGFRASLFHLGVLRRMAELDLLRQVEVLSTVSGGSIIGALYILLLKRRLDADASLDRDAYVGVIDEAQEILVKAIQKNLRLRLFCNPLGVLRVLLTEHSLGKRMARLYERYLYQRPVEQLQPRPWWKLWHPGRMRLRDVRFSPGGGPVTGGMEAYNAAAGTTLSKVPNLIINATSLNSGAPFHFSSVEIGDPRLGSFRYDEIESDLMPRKELLQEMSFTTLTRALAAGVANLADRGRTYPIEMVRYAAWWRAARQGGADLDLRNISRLFQIDGFPGPLSDAEFGILRRAKLSAWYLRIGPTMTPPVTGGVPASVHLARFWVVIREVDEDFATHLAQRIEADRSLLDELLDFILHLYYLRTAEVMSPRIDNDWQKLTLGEAVGASACFPPVFPPLIVLGFYDDLWVTRLGLTDGGVYDNLGITTLLDEGCTHIIASDTGGLFDITQRVSTGRLGMSARISNILMDDVAELQRKTLREGRRISRAIAGATGSPYLAELQARYPIEGLVFFRINSLPPAVPGLDPEADSDVLARIRTDLDAFGDVEIAALLNHGYGSADYYIRKYLGNSPYADPTCWQPPAGPPVPLAVPGPRLRRILVAARARFFRALRLGAPLSWIFTLAALGGVVWQTLDVRVSVRGMITWLADRATDWVQGVIPWLGEEWVNYAGSIGLTILGIFMAVLIVKGAWPWLIARFRHQYPRVARKFVFAVKWVRSYAANLLWLVGGAPLLIALGGAAIAWVSYLFYSLPFLAKTRNRE